MFSVDESNFCYYAQEDQTPPIKSSRFFNELFRRRFLINCSEGSLVDELKIFLRGSMKFKLNPAVIHNVCMQTASTVLMVNPNIDALNASIFISEILVYLQAYLQLLYGPAREP